MMDLPKTIEDDEDVPNYSESSEEETDVQPEKRARREVKGAGKTAAEFDTGFEFFGDGVGGGKDGYLNDQWGELTKFLKKKKPKTSLDERIERVRKERKKKQGEKPDDQATAQTVEVKEEEEEEASDNEDDNDVEDELSDDELVHDNINVKKKKKKGTADENSGKDAIVNITEEDNLPEDYDEEDENQANFFEMPDSLNKDATFQAMNLSRPLLKAIEAMRFAHPTPIQGATIPVALAGRDICGCAATGTGKTAAYLLPILERLLFRSKAESITRVLVMVPTRELGVQVFQVSKQLCQFTSIDVALSVGGLDLRLQEAALRKNPDIVIATPGRLIDHIKNTPTFGLENIEVLILDEADRLLEESFLDQIKEVVKSCAPTRQTMLFSATMTDTVNELAAMSLRKPVKIFVDSNRAVAWNLQQEFVRIRSTHEKNQEAVLASLLFRTCRDHAIVFIRTKQQCHRLHIVLGLLGLKVGELHGNMSQAQRLESLKAFKDEQIDILLTTDVAARGLDISGVKTVVNYQLPETVEQYIHRVGRTARAGRAGRSVSFATEQNRKIVKQIVGQAVRPVKSRVIPPNIIEKYIGKIKDLEPEVKQIIDEETAEREIAKLENRANRLQNRLTENGAEEPEREWMDRGKNKKDSSSDRRNSKSKKKRKVLKKEMAGEDREAMKTGDFLIRENKRNRRLKKIRSFNEDDSNPKKASKGKKNKSKF